MKKIIIALLIVFVSSQAFCQKKVYFTSPAELIFQFTKTAIDSNSVHNGVRTTYFTNLPYYMHINFNNNFGLMQGISIKNIGIKTKDEEIDSVSYDKVKRRVFAAGLCAALKFGFSNKGYWLYTGGGIDWAFHYRQKLYSLGKKEHVTKEGEWMSEATPTFIPSAFVGVQTPFSLNIRATYYFNDFLNSSYKGPLGDFTKFKESQLFTLTFSLVFKDKAAEDSGESSKKKGEFLEL